jgi:hypothetical protein
MLGSFDAEIMTRCLEGVDGASPSSRIVQMAIRTVGLMVWDTFSDNTRNILRSVARPHWLHDTIDSYDAYLSIEEEDGKYLWVFELELNFANSTKLTDEIREEIMS